MDVINVIVSGEKKSGKSTFASALRLTKTNPYILNIVDHDDMPITQNLSDFDIMFYVMDVNNTSDEVFL
jgi:septin family protein